MWIAIRLPLFISWCVAAMWDPGGAVLRRGNTVSLGQVRITVHSASMLRAEWSNASVFEDRPSVTWLNRSVGAPFTHAIVNGRLVVRTSKVELRYDPNAAPTPAAVNPAANFGIGELAVTFLNRGQNHTWSSRNTSATDSCRVWGHDRRPCGAPDVNETTCAALGCCFRGFSDPLSRSCEASDVSVKCFHPLPIGRANLNGSNDVFDCYAGSKDCSRWYQSRMAQGLISKDGWAVHDDGGQALLDENDAWIGSGGWRIERPYRDTYRDWMIFAHGTDFRAALRDFVSVAGPIAMMDYAMYGIWYSKYWKPGISEATVKAILAEYKRRSLPLNGLVLDVGWHIEENGAMAKNCQGYGGYTWNKTLFADPQRFTRWLHHEEQLKLMVNTHDYIGMDPCQEFYRPMALALGVDPTSNATLTCAWTNKTFSNAVYTHALDARTNGSISEIDYLWSDYDREGSGYMGSDQAYWFQCPYDDRGASPLLWSTHVHVRRAEALGRRGLVMTPMGGLGQHRYPLAGSGDTAAAWATLAYQVYQSATAANVGVHWSHDLGGFDPDQSNTRPDWPNQPEISGQYAGYQFTLKMCSWPELWLRWVQFGVFSPVFRTHCEAACSCQPWDYMIDRTYTHAITAAFQLRKSLIPYIYSAAYDAYRTGIAINHGVYFDAPEFEEAYSEDQQQTYLFGSSMLVAAIAHPGVTANGSNSSASLRTQRSIWLPPGEWYSWLQRCATQHNGPKVIHDSFALDETPVFVKAGAMIPTKSRTHSRSEAVVSDPLVWLVFPTPSSGPSTGRGMGTLYEDAGEGLGYQRAEHQTFKATQRLFRNVGFGVLEIVVEALSSGNTKRFAPAQRTQQLQVLSPNAQDAKSVHCNGKHLERIVAVTGYDRNPKENGVKGYWDNQHEGPWHVVLVSCPALPYTATLNVTVKF